MTANPDPLPPPAAPSGSGVPRETWKICPRCTDGSQLEHFAGQWHCLSCGYDFAAPLEFMRIEDHDRLVADLHAALARAEQERDARVSVEALRAINSQIQAAVQKYRSPTDAVTRAIAGDNPIGQMPISQVWTLFCQLDALCATAGEPPADDELARVTRQRDVLQGELDTLRLKLLEFAP